MRILVTGGCGFIGTNVVKRYAQEHEVIVIDDLSRPGSERNLAYLQEHYPFEFLRHNIVMPLLSLPPVDVIFHLAAQVGVQSSLEDPMNDYLLNIQGTLNVLEYARRHVKKPIVIYASTNKVYGDIQVNQPISESMPLNFHTPYGCSKGAADQYVLDYSRVFDVPGIVFRQSCIYGPHQQGREEQGWVAWFLIANHTNQPLTIYGDGTQIRDALYIDDLLDAYDLAIQQIDKTRGQAFNVGGGDQNTLSLNQLVSKQNIQVPITFADWRKADQRYYVSDIRKIQSLIGWTPKVSVDEGLAKLRLWIENPISQ